MSDQKSMMWLGIDLHLEETLDYVTFSRTDKNGFPVYNNFVLYFRPDTSFSQIYRGRTVFIKFKNENPELEERITKQVNEIWPDLNALSLILYEGYRIMKSYTIDGKIVLNYPDLF